ncbi:MAG: S8 family serine peptidase [Rhodobacteraceae bacterium]|nr:S8 family serine peptidase [Paracoccaceae bacterium]
MRALFSMTVSWKTGNTGWYIGGAIAALLMILLAESSAPPRSEITTSTQTPYKKDFRPVLKNIKTIPEHLLDEKTKRQKLLVKRLAGAPEPTNGPMAILFQMEEVRITYLDQLDISTVEVPATWNADWLLEIIRQDPSVDYAGMEYSGKRVPHSLPFGNRPNDPSFNDQTNLHDQKNDVDVDAPEAWAYTTGSDNVVVVVVDNRFDVNNPELRPNLWINSSETAGDSMDNDNNGCTDDIHGCYFNGSRSDGYLDVPSEDVRDGHGTLVASVLGARGNNNNEIAGVAWNIRMMFLNDSNLSVDSYNYILKMRRRGVNIRVVNYSRGPANGFEDCDSRVAIFELSSKQCKERGIENQCMEYMSLEQLEAEGILLVTSAGNNGINYNNHQDRLPTVRCYDLDNIIVVAGQSKTARERWDRTNYGDMTADLYAPAEEIPTSPRQFLPDLPGKPDMQIDPDGTSLAAPHVAAAAALLWSFKPDLTVTEVRSALLNTVDRFDSFKLRDENGVPTTDTVASGGALNIANALYSVATPGIRIHSSQTTIAEGTSGYIDLSLTREPVRPSSGEVVVLEGVATPLSDADAVVTPSTLTFTSRNWHIPQRMTVRAAGTSGSEITLRVSVNDERSTTDYRTMVRTATMTLQSEGIRPTLHIPQRITEGNIATATIHFSDRLLNAAQFTITATGAGTAVEGEHYTLPSPVTAEADSTSATFTIQTINNPGYNGPDKTIHLQVTTENPRISPQALPLQATLTIEDSDTPVMTITVLPRTISQSNTQATAPTATATITLDRMAVQDVTFSLNARPIGGGDINHLFNNISGNTWPTSATIITGDTATEIIIHSIDEDDVEGRTHWIRLYPAIPPDAAARLGQPNRALLITRDDDGDSSTYLRLRVFLEGAVLTNTTTIQTNP